MDRWDSLTPQQCFNLIQGFNDDDDDDDEAPSTCFSGAAAMQPASSAFASAPSSSPNRDAPSISSFQVGSRVRVTGLVAAKQHNGKLGTVSIAIDAVTERLGVELD